MTLPPNDGSPGLLLNASVLVFLFRALAGARSPERRREVAPQLLRLLSDFVPFTSGHALLGEDEFEAQFGDPALWRRLTSEGAFNDNGTAAVPLYASGSLAGALILRGVDAGAMPVLSAVASLASIAIESVREVERLRDDCADLERRLPGNGGILGRSPQIRKLLEQIDKLALRDTTVLIQGESGTGKELVARRLHRASHRAGGPFIALNCAAIADTLMESELFGHEKGAFTGAAAAKKGKFETADGGTLFLDEIGELALPLQAKLLRVLQEREVERIGGARPIKVNIRVIAATNRDLQQQLKDGTFRPDLFHRLNVIALRTPTLRERKDDIAELAAHFLSTFSAHPPRLTPEALRCLEAYDWPGNVRELANAMEHAVVLGNGGGILPSDLPETIWETAPAAELGAFQATVSDAKRESILRAYQQSGGDYKGAAQLLGLHPNYLLRLVRNLGLREALRK
jgi:transcriptional regulator with GAF, ATPase, and Fis domain